MTVFALSCGVTLLNGCKKEEEPPVETSEPSCAKDDSRDAQSTVALPFNTPMTGYICPKQDMDWYAFKLESGDRLLSISTKMSADISPIELTYAVYPITDTEKAAAVPASDGLEEVHCLEPGNYYLVVRDQGNDNEDIRHSYTLTLSGRPEPDSTEPNNALDTATALISGSTTTGHIACAGDQDWYRVEVAQGNVLAIHLTSAVARFQPRLRLLSADGNALVERVNEASTVEATSIDVFYVPLASGQYYIAVSDDDDKEADPEVSYTLAYEAVEDKDTHEPNNAPSDATPLASATQSCGSTWSSAFVLQGTVGARGDIDWYKLPVTTCAGGVVEADVQFNTQGLSASDAWQFQSQVQASVALVRAHPGSPCSTDTKCQSLQIACDPKKQGWECEGYFNSCLSDGFCSGGAACLPSGVCGATQTERHYRVAAIPANISDYPPANHVSLSAPLFGDDVVYLRVSDYQSDGGDASVPYTLSVRIRSDPDPADRASPPNNLYANLLNNDNFPIKESLGRAATLPVHDCTAGDCCGASNWVTGAISYQNDVDWYKYTHPCPCKDCLLRLHYQVADGPVTHGLYLYRGESEFFTFNIAGNGTFGDNECLYSYQGHCRTCTAGEGPVSDCSTYYVAIRDYLENGTRDQAVIGTASRWSADQSYRICLEKYFTGCQSPCEVAQDGTCTSP